MREVGYGTVGTSINSFNPNTDKIVTIKSNKPFFVYIADGGFNQWTGSTILEKGVGGSETYIIEMARYIQQCNKFQTVVGFIINIGVLWFFIWKMPKFIFSFFAILQNFVYFGSFLAGLFSAGLVLFYTTLFVVKNISQNLNMEKIKQQKK